MRRKALNKMKAAQLSGLGGFGDLMVWKQEVYAKDCTRPDEEKDELADAFLVGGARGDCCANCHRLLDLLFRAHRTR